MEKKAFMSIKFYEGDKTKQIIQDITEALKGAGIDNCVLIRDVEDWGKIHLPSDALMPDYAFPRMEKSDMLVVEFSEKGVGLGVGAGYCYRAGVPIYLIAKEGSDISSTIGGLARAVIFYKDMADITKSFQKIFARQALPVVLTSKSKYRRKTLEDAGIPFSVCPVDVDETPDETLSLKAQYEDIARRKVLQGKERTEEMGDRILVAADQNLVYNGLPFGKPKNVDEARETIRSMMGHEIEAYVGNAVLVIENGEIVEEICKTDVATMYVNPVSDEELEDYLRTTDVCTMCGGMNLQVTPFLELKRGRKSTAEGMTLQFLRKLSYQ